MKQLFSDHISGAKQSTDLHTNIFSQYLLHDYLMHNDFDSHIQVIRDLYQRQSTAMLEAHIVIFQRRYP